VLIINADDFGLNENTNAAIVHCFEKGLCSSTTIMPNMPGFEQACQLVHEKKLLNHAGVHLVLTKGYPVTDAMKKQVRFCNKDGLFSMDRTRRVFHLSTSEKESLVAEIRAQIIKCRNAGLPLTHADSHHHIHEEPAIARVLIKSLKEFKIPYLRIMANLVPARTAARRMYTMGFNTLLHTLRLAKTDYFCCIDGCLDFKLSKGSLSNLRSLEVMLHPSLNGTGVVVEMPDNKPIEYLIKQIESYGEAQSFSGARYHS
jgi:predicted glycoside hydrolase/deacetylase ChbG (UPF0249 family)